MDHLTNFQVRLELHQIFAKLTDADQVLQFLGALMAVDDRTGPSEDFLRVGGKNNRTLEAKLKTFSKIQLETVQELLGKWLLQNDGIDVNHIMPAELKKLDDNGNTVWYATKPFLELWCSCILHFVQGTEIPGTVEVELFNKYKNQNTSTV